MADHDIQRAQLLLDPDRCKPIPEHHAPARRTIAAHARDAAEAQLFMQMLGLLEEP